MKLFLVNLMPKDIGERVRSHGEKRRMGLLVALLLLSLLGVSLHSWDQARRARAVRDASVISRERIDGLEDELGHLELERQALASFMSTYRGVALPMEMSDILATVVNRLPERATLTDLAARVAERAAPPPAGAAALPGAPPMAALPPRRVLELRIRGFAATNLEVSAFERALAATPPLTTVRLGENRSMDTPDGNFQEFVITAEVELDREYAAPSADQPLALDRRPTNQEAVR